MKTVHFSMRMSPSVKRALERLAKVESRTMAGEVEALVREKCKKLQIPVSAPTEGDPS